MQHIDWDKLRSLLPIYAYEYDTHGHISICTDYWYPHSHPAGTEPPPGWDRINYHTDYDSLMQALADYLNLQPNQKAVWFNNHTGEFSNSWPHDPNDKIIMGALAEQMDGKNPQWKLIIYHCASDSNFEFSGLMKVVTNVRKKK